MSIQIRPAAATDRAAWGALYAAYAEFYQVTQTEAMRDRVWDWVMDDGHSVTGLVAEGATGLIGIAHVREFARPLAAATGGYLDDLYVDPGARGGGAADALIDAARALGVARGWGVIRWITAEDNARARKVYDRMAAKTGWVTYDLLV
ncbi:N-acetyltransferase family protein [Yoonia sp. R2331]|uniref:GNAT family N-acetyltransferase n=1 Tax=Yoonia sp. R2331 TaxID=3237238 RepID=UPI0034E4B0D3